MQRKWGYFYKIVQILIKNCHFEVYICRDFS